MTPSTLNRIGSALYGAFWQSRLADDVGVNSRTMRRWLSGEWPMPDTLKDELRQIILRRRQELLEALEALE
jgi:hypothetical protein